jgi:hypothetical protein
MVKEVRQTPRFFLACCICILCFAAHSSFAQTFTINGNIKNGVTNSQIIGAVITLKETPYSAISDAAGSFQINDIPKNKYVLNIIVPGFQAYQVQLKLDENKSIGTITIFPIGYEDGTAAALQKTIRATNVAELFSNRPNFIGGQSVFGIAPEAKQLIGNYYLDQKWNKASILLYKESEIIEGYMVRYHIQNNSFEIRAEDSEEITSIPGMRIRNIVWLDSKYQVPRYFINGMDLKDEGAPILGFFEVLVDGKLPLVRRTVASIKAANYNTALMVGNKNDTIMKRNVYYYIDGKNLIQIPKKKKQIFTIFGEKASELEAFAKENALNLREASSWFTLFTQYNSKFDGFEPLIPKLTD